MKNLFIAILLASFSAAPAFAFDKAQSENDYDGYQTSDSDINGDLEQEMSAELLLRPTVEYVRCESRNDRFNRCWFVRKADRVRMVQVHSRSACIPGQSFGVARHFVWVDQGCRATFAVYHR